MNFSYVPCFQMDRIISVKLVFVSRSLLFTITSVSLAGICFVNHAKMKIRLQLQGHEVLSLLDTAQTKAFMCFIVKSKGINQRLECIPLISSFNPITTIGILAFTVIQKLTKSKGYSQVLGRKLTVSFHIQYHPYEVGQFWGNCTGEY